MSTSDQQEQGPLTRKQLREIRLTGSTPVITPEEAAAAAADVVVPPVPPLPSPAPAEVVEEPGADAPASDEPASSSPSVESSPDSESAPLTRRQARAQERVRTDSVSVVAETGEQPAAEEPAVEAPAAEESVAPEPIEAPVEPQSPAIVSAVPDFARPVAVDVDDDDEGVDDVVSASPVSASAAVDSAGEVPLEVLDDSEQDAQDDVAALGLDDEVDPDDVDDADALVHDERPTVSSAFGEGLLADTSEASKPFTPSFDELLSVGDSTGSQHIAPSALIFTPSPGEGSLSGPVASTGEILVTGSYELPQGIGSQGHAHGLADGKEVDAVLIDGELPPASSPTPIAASSAVSTIKPAGEVIRPPAPDKGNKLMLTLAITAGGLALALGVVLIFAFTTKLI
ncbi:MAG: hypothetical protein P0Y60_12175 [Candidatus Microbacterium colombiense]|nr:MAG: hypothetical protein P0Y60_12175 [Microbacterium sp.]